MPAEPDPLSRLPGIDSHPHARAVLGAALSGRGEPSHAYLFHGPAGTGKRAVALAFAAELLAEGSADPDGARARALRLAHPDLTWVSPSGAAEMLVSDIEEPVVAASTRTPFEAARRVFVIDDAGAMNDDAANRMLKTLEEPASFVHVVLLAALREDVLPTIASRCQAVRFDPLAPELLAARLDGVEPERALACARLAQGDGALAARLASPQGAALRERAELFVRGALAGETAAKPWMGLLEAARDAGAAAGERAEQELAERLELLPAKERRRHERESADARRRGERRARTGTLDLGLRLGELWLRDLMCIGEGAPELALAADRSVELGEDAAAHAGPELGRAIELVSDTRLSLAVFVSEELALEALAYRLRAPAPA
jgi:DNA polymerase-3 subunit delta'